MYVFIVDDPNVKATCAHDAAGIETDPVSETLPESTLIVLVEPTHKKRILLLVELTPFP